MYKNSILDIVDEMYSTIYGTTDSFLQTTYPYKIHEEDDHYLLELNLPGFEKDDIDIDIVDDVLSIKYDGEEKEDRWKKSFKKRFNLNAKIDTNNVKASMDKGILSLILSKSEKMKSKTIKIK